MQPNFEQVLENLDSLTEAQVMRNDGMPALRLALLFISLYLLHNTLQLLNEMIIIYVQIVFAAKVV